MFSIDRCALVIVDVQGKLAYLMQHKDQLFQNIQSLIHTAVQLNIPIILTEQAPEKIGKTVPEILDSLNLGCLEVLSNSVMIISVEVIIAPKERMRSIAICLLSSVLEDVASSTTCS